MDGQINWTKFDRCSHDESNSSDICCRLVLNRIQTNIWVMRSPKNSLQMANELQKLYSIQKKIWKTFSWKWNYFKTIKCEEATYMYMSRTLQIIEIIFLALSGHHKFDQFIAHAYARELQMSTAHLLESPAKVYRS